MADQLYLTYRLRGYSPANMLRHYEKLLRAFPYSRLSTGASVLRMYAVSASEPVLFENSFDDPPDAGAVLDAAKPFASGDCAILLDTRWDLWQFDREWQLTPARVTLGCFGPEYEDADGAHLQIEFGIDTHFLPQRDLPNHLFMARSNIRSLLHLVAELDGTLSAESRRLWSDSGENFAERVQAYIAGQEDE